MERSELGTRNSELGTARARTPSAFPVPRSQFRIAFTLVEILVVVVIIVILVGLIVAGLEIGGAQAYKTKCASNLKQLGAAVLAFAEPNAGYLPPVSTRPDGASDNLSSNQNAGFFREDDTPSPDSPPPGAITNGYYWNLGALWRDQHIKGDGQVFFCPAQPEGNKNFRGETYSSPKFHSEGVDDKAIYLPYYYNPITASGVMPSTSDRVPLFTRAGDLGGHSSPPSGAEWKRQPILLMDHARTVQDASHVSDRKTGSDAAWNVLVGDLSLASRVDPEIYRVLQRDTSGNIPKSDYVTYDKDILQWLVQGR